MIVAVAVIALVAIAGAVLLLTRGGDDGEADAPESTAANIAVQPTTTAAATSGCAGANGHCVVIDSISASGDEVIARYSTIGFEPDIDGGPDSKHIHFYFDTVPVEEAGMPAPSTNWVVWDVDPATGDLLYRFSGSSIPPGATELCASVANVNHGLDDHLSSCLPLP